MQRIALLAVGLAGCLAPPAEHDDGGQSGVANPPVSCVEDDRGIVADPTVPAEGFAFAAADALARVSGRWDGAADLDGAGEVAVALDIRPAGDVIAVRSHLEGGDGAQTEGLGAPAVSCPPVYEIPLALEIAAPPALSADVPALWVIVAVDGPDGFAGATPADQVDGTLQPPEWPEADLWDRELLSAWFLPDAPATGAPQPATLGLDWVAVDDDADGGAQGAATSTVAPSGTTAPIGSIGLTRAP